MATPIRNNNSKVTPCTPTSSTCLIWDGGDLPCIELCHGDSINEVQFKIATILCDIVSQTDMTEVDLKCLANPAGFYGATGSGDIVSTLNVNTTSKGNIGTGEDDLISYTIAGNQLSKDGDYLSFDFAGTIANTVSTKRIKVLFGSTTLFDSGASAIPISQAIDWTIRGEIIRTSATTYKANTYFNTNNSTFPASSDFVSGTATFSSTLILKGTGEASLDNDIKQESLIVRKHSKNTAHVPLTSENATLRSIISELITKYCDLNERVVELEAAPTVDGNGNIVFTVSADCIRTIVGVPLSNSPLFVTPTNDQIIQLIIEGVCTTYQQLQDAITDLTIRIDNISTSGGGTGLPLVSSDCLFAGTKTIDQAWILLDADYCEIKEKVGTVTDIDDALTVEGSEIGDINAILGLALTASTNLGDSVKNIWTILGELTDNYNIMNTTLLSCCGFRCKDFEITMTTINFDSAALTIDLRLLFNGSTTLPPAYTFTDAGSYVTFTDQTGYAVTYTIDIADPASYQNLDLTGFDLTGDIDVDATIDFTLVSVDPDDAREFACTKCIHSIFRSGAACAFCVLIVSITGDDPEVVITYTVDSVVHTLTITTESVNAEYVIPANAVITSILNVNNSVVTVTSTSCPNLSIPDVDTLACYAFIITPPFYDSIVDDVYYSITGYNVDGTDVVTYPDYIRSDFHDIRSIDATNQGYTTSTEGSTENCTFDVLPSSSYPEYYESLVKLQNIPANAYIYGVSKLCTKIIEGSGTAIIYNIAIVRAVSGKTILMKFNNNIAVDSNLAPQLETYIEGVEIPTGEDCDCCYVYAGE